MKNHYFCSINTHFWKLVVILSSIFLRIMVANTEIMGCCLCIAIWVTKMKLQKLLMLLWRSFLGGGSDIITNIFAHTGGSFCHCGLMMLHSPLIIEDARQKVADPRLTLNITDRAISVSDSFLPIQTANTCNSKGCESAALSLSKEQD